MKTITEKENKDFMLRVRMSNSDLKNLKKISKQSKINSYSEVIRTLIESKVKELSKQKNIFE